MFKEFERISEVFIPLNGLIASSMEITQRRLMHLPHPFSDLISSSNVYTLHIIFPRRNVYSQMDECKLQNGVCTVCDDLNTFFILGFIKGLIC